METLYAIYVQETDKDKERLIWYSVDQTKSKRRYFYGGSAIMACIFTTPQSAHAVVKKARKDFDPQAQFYVRRINLIKE